MKLSNGIYDKLKWFVTIVLPAFSAFYLGLANVWNLPNATQVGTTAALTAAFLGTILGISTKTYNKSDERFDGALVYSGEDDDRIKYDMRFKDEPNIEGRKELRFKVVAPPKK